MADEKDITGVDIVSDLNPGNETVVEQVNEQPDDIRTLLEQAANLQVDEEGRVRDATGKFAKKPVEGEEAQQPPNEGVEQQAPPQEQQAPKFSAELDQAIQALPAEHRTAVETAIATREGAWMNFARQVEGHVTGYERLKDLEPLLAPRAQAWAIQGASPAQAVSQLLALSDFATRDPKGFVNWFAGNNNIDLSEIGEEYVPVDPTIDTLQKQVGILTNALNGMQNGAIHNQHQQYVQSVQQFETEQDAQGQPLRPHFAEVANHMLALVPIIRQQMPGAGPKDVLQTAYDQAVHANPATRAKVVASSEASALAARAAEAAKAGKAGQSMSGSGPANRAVTHELVPGDTVRGALEHAFAQHS